METVCHNQLRFESLFSKEVIADFAGGRITSDAGGLVLRELASATASRKTSPVASMIPVIPTRLNMIS
jgi:hypothetical protein